MGGSERQREVWEGLGDVDPDWAVLTESARRGRAWEQDQEAFYATGIHDMDECLALLTSEPPLRRALDYGSGTGRLTLALARRFERVTALDASRSMLALLAERAAKHGIGNVTTVVPEALEDEACHDFALSLLVLQHLESRIAIRQALASIATALCPGGQAVLEIPERPLTVRARLQPRWNVFRVARRLGVRVGWLQRHGFSGISMTTVDRSATSAWLHAVGLDVTAIAERPSPDYLYVRYVVRKG